jgi:CheY-like chemotaxis protein
MKNILLVEDDSFLIDIYTKQLTKEGFNVILASDGESAIGKIKELNPDLVMLDIILPKISGWEVLRKIREELNLKDLKIIVLSALSQKEDLEKGAVYNILKYLCKTENTPSQITEEVKKILI